ncbi:hypothetical protein [Bradyrhizobium sp. WD16]|uniref:hypothetical protein n=1 Tax=Bradyrhizobium sp. WD16 TaxID=1521768 RepID=UPI0020A3169F|nr:hypothetical protein [Bradyrhizobium sp. WD16]UTD25566.1 hypothetical protein DB459_00235 [Bradyrhizobium sp. WD16]
MAKTSSSLVAVIAAVALAATAVSAKEPSLLGGSVSSPGPGTASTGLIDDIGTAGIVRPPNPDGIDRLRLAIDVVVPSPPTAEECILWVFKNICVPVTVTVLREVCEEVAQPAPTQQPAPSTTGAPPAKPIVIKVKKCKKVPQTVTKQQCTQKRVCQKPGK